jgi:hypothetical protein
VKITFIMPNLGCLENGAYVDEGSMEPLPLAVLAGLTPPDVECVLYDDRIEPIPFDESTDLVAISVEIFTARRSYEIAAEYRARGVPVIMGGFHPTLSPDECLEHADAVFLGDAESLWARVVEDARRGALRRVYRAPPGPAQAGGVLPRRDLFRGKKYLPISLVQFSRGCRFACNFCAISSYFGARHFVRRTREVLDGSRRDRRLVFVDDNFLSITRRGLHELVPPGSAGSRRPDRHDVRSRTHGPRGERLRGNVIGFESLNAANLRAMGKGPAMRLKERGANATGWDRYDGAVETLRQHHLQTWAAFTLGHDQDTAETIRETCDFAIAKRFCFAAFNILMPYPSTPLYDRLSAWATPVRREMVAASTVALQPRGIPPRAYVGGGVDGGLLAGAIKVEPAGIGAPPVPGSADAPQLVGSGVHVLGVQPALREGELQEAGNANDHPTPFSWVGHGERRVRQTIRQPREVRVS